MNDINKSIQGHSDHMDKMRKKYPKGSTHQDKKGNTVVNESRSKALEKAKGGKKKEGEVYNNLQKGHSFSKKNGKYLD